MDITFILGKNTRSLNQITFNQANPRVCVPQYDEEGEEADDEVRLFKTLMKMTDGV